MRVLPIAAQGIERAGASAEAAAKSLVAAGAGEGDVVSDMVSLSLSARLLSANVAVARTAIETERDVVHKLSVRG